MTGVSSVVCNAISRCRYDTCMKRQLSRCKFGADAAACGCVCVHAMAGGSPMHCVCVAAALLRASIDSLVPESIPRRASLGAGTRLLKRLRLGFERKDVRDAKRSDVAVSYRKGRWRWCCCNAKALELDLLIEKVFRYATFKMHAFAKLSFGRGSDSSNAVRMKYAGTRTQCIVASLPLLPCLRITNQILPLPLHPQLLVPALPRSRKHICSVISTTRLDIVSHTHGWAR